MSKITPKTTITHETVSLTNDWSLSLNIKYPPSAARRMDVLFMAITCGAGPKANARNINMFCANTVAEKALNRMMLWRSHFIAFQSRLAPSSDVTKKEPVTSNAMIANGCGNTVIISFITEAFIPIIIKESSASQSHIDFHMFHLL